MRVILAIYIGITILNFLFLMFSPAPVETKDDNGNIQWTKATKMQIRKPISTLILSAIPIISVLITASYLYAISHIDKINEYNRKV